MRNMRLLWVCIVGIAFLFLLAACGRQAPERGEGVVLYTAGAAEPPLPLGENTHPPQSTPEAPQDNPQDTYTPAPVPPADGENDATAPYVNGNEAPAPENGGETATPTDTHPHAWHITPRPGGIPPTGARTAASLHPFSAFYRGAESRYIFLTFELFYETGHTDTLLDILQDKNIPAAFFVTHAYFMYNGDMVRRMIADGHVIGLRSMQPLTDIEPDDVSDALLYPRYAFREAFGRTMDPFLRPAAGAFNDDTLGLAWHYGFYTIFWSAAAGDWARAAENPHPGMILSLSGITAANATALGTALDALYNEGWRFATLYDLI